MLNCSVFPGGSISSQFLTLSLAFAQPLHRALTQTFCECKADALWTPCCLPVCLQFLKFLPYFAGFLWQPHQMCSCASVAIVLPVLVNPAQP